MKRTISLLLAMVLCFGAIPFFGIEASATTNWPSLSTSAYCEFIATKSIYCYRNSSCTERGTITPLQSYNASISKDDLCLITGISDSWIRVAYPTSSGYKTAYIKRSELFGVSVPTECVTSQGKATVYSNINGISYGSTAKGDTVYACGTSSNHTLVIYTAKSGSRAFKLGYVKTSDYNSIIKGVRQLLSNGKYVIVSSLNNNMVVDVNGASNDNCANVQLWSRNGSGAQIFTVTYNDGGWYTIINSQSGKALDVANGEAKCGQNVQQYQTNGTNAQKWYLEDAGGGYFYIRSALGYYLDANGGVANNGTNIQIWTGNKTNAQKFRFENYGSSDWRMPMNNAVCTWDSDETMSWATYNNRSGDRDYHIGIDIYGTDGKVYAAADGEVVACSNSNSGGGANGRFVIIQHTISGKTVYSFYAHLASMSVKNGQLVNKGTQIGIAGGSGSGSDNKYGVHLHFAIIDTLNTKGGYDGYTTKFSGNKVKHKEMIFYNPIYVIDNNALPE